MLMSNHIQAWHNAWLEWKIQFISYAPKFTISLIILILTFILASHCRRLTNRVLHKKENLKPIVKYLASLVSVAIFIIGLVTALATAGINVTALITSLGLLGFSLGMAFKDLLSNSIAGVMIIIYQPFRMGDVITIDKYSGRVTQINLRYTSLKKDTNTMILVPNQNLLNTAVTVKCCLSEEKDGVNEI